MSAAPPVDPVTRLAWSLWLAWPRRVIRRWPGLHGTVGDGHFLVTVPPLAVLAPPLLAAAAFAVGAGRLGYDAVYTESLGLMVVAVAIGCVSTQLGLIVVAAFAAGEFFLAERSWSLVAGFTRGDRFSSGLAGNLARVRLPLVITYLLLAAVVVVVPRTARGLMLGVGRWRRIPPNLAWPLGSILLVVVVWIGVRTWAAAGPTLVRPRFTFVGGNPTAATIEPLQRRGDNLVAAGVIATMARQVWIGLTMYVEPARGLLRAAEASGERSTAASAPPPAAPSTARRVADAIAVATLATLTLAGILERTWLWIVAFAVFLVTRLLRSGLVRLEPLVAWQRLVARVPVIARLLVLWVLARIATDSVSNNTIKSYTGLAVFVLAGTVGAFAIFPGAPPPEPSEGASS